MIKISILFVLLILFAGYSSFVYTRGTEAAGKRIPFSEAAANGKFLFQKYNCTACHQFYGLGGYLGPDLTKTISKNGELFTAAIMKTGTKQMPDYKLKSNEITDLVEYLKYIDRTANAGGQPVK